MSYLREPNAVFLQHLEDGNGAILMQTRDKVETDSLFISLSPKTVSVQTGL